MPNCSGAFNRNALVSSLALVVFCAIPIAANAWPAVQMNVGVKNTSDACVWVTPYAASFITPWRIINHGGDNRPHFLAPGHTAYWSTAIEQPLSPVGAKTPVEIKILTERSQHANCTGSNQPRISKENKGLFADKGLGTHGSVYTIFQGARGQYSLTDLRQPIPKPF